MLHVPVLTAYGGASEGGNDDGVVPEVTMPIAATASRLPGKPGLVMLVSEPGPGVPGRHEELRSVEELLRCDDPSHPFALHRACVALTVAQRSAAAGPAADVTFDKNGDPPSRPDAGTVRPESLADVLTRFLGAPGMGLELRTRVDLPRGSGLGSSSVLALAAIHALHELSMGCEWRPSVGDAT